MKKIILTIFAFLLLIITSCMDGSGVIFTRNVNPTPILFNTDIDDNISAWSTNFYSFTSGEAGNYFISLTNQASDLGWIICLYPTPGEADIRNCFHEKDSDYNTTDENDTVTLASSTSYIIRVDEHEIKDSSYTLRINYPLD
ncbi:hypothetical protein ACFL20_06445 [Spirochaetota bacterium]